MKSVIEYLDDLKEKTGSDYKSAKLINVKGSTISMIRSRGQMADETAIKVADLLGIDRGEILLAAAIARSEGETLSAWGELAKRLKQGVALSLLVTIIGIWPNDSMAENKAQTTDENIHYANHLIILAYP